MNNNAEVGGTFAKPSAGNAGLNTQVPGAPMTVSALAGASGGVGMGNLVMTEIDQELAKFNSDETPLMSLMLYAKTVQVNSPEVAHYMIDNARSSVTTTAAVAASTSINQFQLPLAGGDQQALQAQTTLSLVGVPGYTSDGKTAMPGRDLMVFVTGHDTSTGHPVVRAVNGPKNSASDEYCTVPAIPAGTKCIILSNALYETQAAVDPTLIVPQPTEVYLQKRGMSQVVSAYFEAQKKNIPFSKAVVAENNIAEFKRAGNRGLYLSNKGKFTMTVPKVGAQTVYTSDGVRNMVRREMKHTGEWTYDQLIGLAKFIYTGEDVPSRVIALCGKNFLESIQMINYEKHPEVQIVVKENQLGWVVTSLHTVFGDIEFKRDPALDTINCSNSAFICDPDKLVHYQLVSEHKKSENIEGEEATRESILVWDALALKGGSHIWIDGEDNDVTPGVTTIFNWDSASAPTSPVKNALYYLLSDCAGINANAKKGEFWKHNGTSWSKHTA